MAYVQCVHKGGKTPMHGQTSSGRNNNATSDTRIGSYTSEKREVRPGSAHVVIEWCHFLWP